MSERERIAYEELQAGDLVQAGDEWQNDNGHWHPLVVMAGACIQVRDNLRARRPHNITMMLAAFASSAEVLADAQQAATQLQSERDEFQTALIESRLALKRKVAEVMEVCKERDEAWTALKSAQRARDELQLQVDELQADRTDEPTARQVQDMLRTWATELDWSAGCFGSFGRSQIDIIQQTMVAVIERIESIVNPEGGHAND